MDELDVLQQTYMNLLLKGLLLIVTLCTLVSCRRHEFVTSQAESLGGDETNSAPSLRPEKKPEVQSESRSPIRAVRTRIVSEPDGADVYVNAQPLGKTPMHTELRSGDQILLVLEGHKIVKDIVGQSVTMPEGGQTLGFVLQQLHSVHGGRPCCINK